VSDSTKQRRVNLLVITKAIYRVQDRQRATNVLFWQQNCLNKNDFSCVLKVLIKTSVDHDAVLLSC